MNTHPFAPVRPWPFAAVLAMLLAACTNTPTAHEQSLGESVRQAQALQSVQPPGHTPARGNIVTDGVAAAHAMDRYHQTFARPPAPLTVLNIQSGGAAQAMPALPR